MQSYRHILRSVLCVGAVGVGAMAMPVQGSLLALEQFDYTAGADNLGTFNGGTGWSGGWKNDGALTTASTEDVQSSSLPTPDGFYGGGQGGSIIEAGAVAYRALSSDLRLDVDQDYYVSLLTRRSGSTAKSMTISLMSSATNTVAMFGHSTGGTLFVGGIGATTSGSAPRVGIAANPEDSNTFLWVFKISAKATGNDQVFLKTYRTGAGTVDATEPATWEVTGEAAPSNSSVVNRFGIATSTQTLEFDDIRIGTTWAEVAVVPEPASISFIGLAGLALLGRRRARA